MNLQYSFNQDIETLKFLLSKKEKHNFYSEEITIDYELEKEYKWNKLVDSITFDFKIDNSIPILQEFPEKGFDYKTLKIFQSAVNLYLEEKKEKDYLKEISIKSLKNFLYLLPLFEKYEPSLNIDSDTGCINTTFMTKDNGLLTALTNDKGEICFSRVSEGIKIYKISGVAKIKDTRDFKYFEKVLRML